MVLTRETCIAGIEREAELGNDCDAVAGEPSTPAGTEMDTVAGMELDTGTLAAKTEPVRVAGADSEAVDGRSAVPAGALTDCVAGMDMAVGTNNPGMEAVAGMLDPAGENCVLGIAAET
jgi:hypothetical protein